jgi:hypothetical protein
MKRALLIIVALSLTACSPYTRYGEEARRRPVQPVKGAPVVPLNDYLRLGMLIRTKLGTPYLGSSKYTRGTDCSGLTQQVFAEYGITIGRSSEDQFRNGVAVPRNRMQFGDLVFFSLKPNQISHVGIYVGFGEFVHASEKLGVIRSRIHDKYWSKSFVGARRVITPRAG